MDKDTPVTSCRGALIALILLTVLAWLPGFFTLPPLDRDESRFAQATKQMLETGDFVDIRLGSQTRYEKPVGIYWMQAVSTAVLGAGARDRIWTYRVPSFLGALASVIATFFIAKALAGVDAGFAAGAVLALSALLMSEAKIAKTDAMLLGTVAVTQFVLMRAYLSARGSGEAPSLGLALLGWAAFALGVLVKGPVIALVCGASVVAITIWDRDLRWLSRLRALPGLALAIVIVAPWLIAIGVATHGAFFQQSLGQDFGAKIVGDAEAHGAPPGYFAVLAHATLWPGSLALLPGLVLAWKRRNEPAIRYLLVWAATAWLMFEAVPTKLPHYILPAYPALAILCGLWLTDGRASETTGERIARVLSLALFAVVGLALAAALVVAPQRYGEGSPWWLYAGAVIGALAVLAAIPLDRRRAAAMAAIAAVVLYQVAGYLTVPRLNQIWLSPRMADAVARHAAPNDPPVITAGYAEPSIAFLLGTGTKLELGAEAGADAAQAGGLVLVDEGERDSFLSAVIEGGARADALEEIAGLNYSRGRQTRITLYRVARESR